nr:MAG TPA: hypothetical protein [Caudoviricetes sp.]
MVLSLFRISVNLCICEWILFVLQDHRILSHIYHSNFDSGKWYIIKKKNKY